MTFGRFLDHRKLPFRRKKYLWKISTDVYQRAKAALLCRTGLMWEKSTLTFYCCHLSCMKCALEIFMYILYALGEEEEVCLLECGIHVMEEKRKRNLLMDWKWKFYSNRWWNFFLLTYLLLCVGFKRNHIQALALMDGLLWEFYVE